MSEYESQDVVEDEESQQPSRRGILLYVTGMLVVLAVVASVLIWYTGSLDREPPGIPPVTTMPTPGTVTPTRPAGTPSPQATPGPSPAATTPARTNLAVGNTGGQGVNLRAQPSTTARVVARLVDGTRLEVVGADVQAEGRAWKQVKDTAGNTGYIAAEFVVPPR